MNRDLDIDRLDELNETLAEAMRRLAIEMDDILSATQLMNECMDPQVVNQNNIDTDTSPELDEFLSGFKVIKE